MSTEIIFVLLILVLMIIGLAFEIAPPELIVFSTVNIFLLCGYLTPEEALKGFSNEGMLTIAFLFIIVGVIQRSSLVETLMRKLLGSGESEKRSIIKILLPVAGLSAFLNNTPIVVALTPLIRNWCIDRGLSPSKFLIPLSYITVLGGTITLIGTSTNLVVHGLMLDSGMRGFSFFDVAIVGLPITVVGIIYLVTIGSKLLPNHRITLKEQIEKQPRNFMFEFIVDSSYQKINMTVEEAGFKKGDLVAIIRGNTEITPVKLSTIITEDDRLIFTGQLSTIVELQRRKGLTIQTGANFPLTSLENGQSQLVEVVVSAQSPLVSKKIQDTQSSGGFDAAIIAVHRNHERIINKIGEVMIKPGDTLLLVVEPNFLKLGKFNDFYVVTPVEIPRPIKEESKGVIIALIMLISMIILVTFNVLSMFKAMAITTIILLFLRIVTPTEAKQSIQFSVLVLIASSYGIGTALVNTGAAYWIANNLITITAPFGLFIVLLVIYLLTNVFTEFMSNAATVVMMFPISIEITNQLNINPMVGIMLITIAASAAFATPIGYQTNLIVYGPGEYHFKDYLKVGIPLNIICMLITVGIVYFTWL